MLIPTSWALKICDPQSVPATSLFILTQVESRTWISTYNLNGGLKLTLKRFADLDGPDFYPTPKWATDAWIDNEAFEGAIWEPACGDGTMARVLLLHTGCPVDASDLFDRENGPTRGRFSGDRVGRSTTSSPTRPITAQRVSSKPDCARLRKRCVCFCVWDSLRAQIVSALFFEESRLLGCGYSANGSHFIRLELW